MKNEQSKIIETTKTQEQLKPKSQKLSLQVKQKKRLVLRFSPTAWAKLLYFREKSYNEVGGFAITDPDDLLFVRDFITVKQEVTSISVKFDDAAVADFFDSQVDSGRRPEQFARIWLHTHPGDSCEPSIVDEETFTRVFGNCQWAVMFIIAQNNKTYSRLSFNVGPGGSILIPTEIDYECDFGPTDHKVWDAEYHANITAGLWLDSLGNATDTKVPTKDELGKLCLPSEFLEEFEKMEPAERQIVLDELAARPELWDDEEVMFYDY